MVPVATAAALRGMGDDDGGEAVDVTAACDRLEELADTILGVADATVDGTGIDAREAGQGA